MAQSQIVVEEYTYIRSNFCPNKLDFTKWRRKFSWITWSPLWPKVGPVFTTRVSPSYEVIP
jgi:hypothetical protein